MIIKEKELIVLHTTQNNQKVSPTRTGPQSATRTGVERNEDNRNCPRFTIPRGIPIKTEVESMSRILRSCNCVNIGAEGVLLDFGEDKCPEMPVQSKLFVIIQLAGETAKLPGIVRHRYGNKLGIFFPIADDPNFEEERKVFAIILRTLERGIQRRTGR